MKLNMPKFEETAETAILIKWLKRPGDRIAKGEAVAEVETEKFSHPVESPINGVLREHLVAEEDEVNAGAPIAVLESNSE